MTTALITGAGGFAGHHCLQHVLAVTDWTVIAIDSFRHKGKTDRINQVLQGHPDWADRVTVVTHDLTVPFSSQSVVMMTRAGPVDFVIAYASDSDVMRSISDPLPCAANNTWVALSTLELCRVLQPAAVVWVSTDEVYGPVDDPDAGFPEWSPIIPSNAYAASKAGQEALCVAYWRTYDVPVIIVNSMNLFGERQAIQKFTPMVMRAVRRGDTLTIHGQPGNIGSRHWLHCRNLADAILFLVMHGAQVSYLAGNLRPARYNLGSPDRVDNLAMAQMITEAMGGDLRYEFSDASVDRPGHDKDYGLDPSKLLAAGWKPIVPFRESLDRTVRWTMLHPEWLEDLQPPNAILTCEGKGNGERVDGIGPLRGDWGTADPMVLPATAGYAPLLQHWLVTSEKFSIICDQYILAVSTLLDFPGYYPAHRDFPEATHEVSLVPVLPVAAGRLPAAEVVRLLEEKRLSVSVADSAHFQVHASDAEAMALGPVLVQGIVMYGWSPAVVTDPRRLIPVWRATITQQLSLLRSQPRQQQPWQRPGQRAEWSAP